MYQPKHLNVLRQLQKCSRAQLLVVLVLVVLVALCGTDGQDFSMCLFLVAPGRITSTLVSRAKVSSSPVSNVCAFHGRLVEEKNI